MSRVMEHYPTAKCRFCKRQVALHRADPPASGWVFRRHTVKPGGEICLGSRQPHKGKRMTDGIPK